MPGDLYYRVSVSASGASYDMSDDLSSLTVEQRERLAFAHFLGFAEKRGWKAGYAWHQFRRRFGRNPHHLWREFGLPSRASQ